MTSALALPISASMHHSLAHAYSPEYFEAVARATIARLPAQFAEHLGDILFQVQDLADRDVLDDLGIANPMHLSGVYEGIPLPEQSIGHSGTMPTRIRLFRLPILAEWQADPSEELDHLIAHVTIHEIGHHFGLSDEAMHALEDEVL